MTRLEFKKILDSIDKEVYKEFVAENKRQDRENWNTILRYPTKAFHTAFLWSDTKKGLSYWLSMMYKYQEKLKEIRKIKRDAKRTQQPRVE